MTVARLTVFRPRSLNGLRATVAALGVLAVALSTLVLASPAHALGFTDGDFQFDNTSATEATVTGYTGVATSITIPSTATDGVSTYTVTAIGNTAFDNAGLTGVVIPDSITSIGQSAFGSNSLVNVVIPNSVTFMDTAVFQNNYTLTSVTLGNSLTSIPGYTFWQTSLTSISIPDSVTSIGQEAFFLNDLVGLNIPDSVTSIGNSAFLWNYSLTSLTLGNSVASIGDNAFNGTSLTAVTLPGSVTSIGNNAFGNTASLASAVFQGGAPSTFTPRSVGDGSFGDQNVTVYYPSAHAADFTPSPWQGYMTAQGATLSFNLGGHGSAINSVTVIPGMTPPASMAPPADPVASGYHFQGWFTSATGGAAFNFTTTMGSDTTAYARWAPDPALAATGTDLLPLLVTGGGLLVIGLLLVVGLRMRRGATAPRG